MQIILARRLNKRLIELYASTRGETVGVLRTDGTYDYRPWLGFMDRTQAIHSGRPVKLLIARVGQPVVDSRRKQIGAHVHWQEVPRGRHVQGCLTPEGVYAVADWNVRLV